MLNDIYTALIQFFFPAHCPSCHAYVEQQGQWCTSCLQKTIRSENLAYDNDVRQYISPVIAIGKYEQGLKNLIHELKYRNNLSTLAYFNPLFDILDKDWDFSSYDMIIPVPLHAHKLKQRGFNQVEKIFTYWINKHHFNYCNILERTRKTQSQYQLHRNERKVNVSNAFALKPNQSVKNRKCLLIDDIFTTGNTLKNCAIVLKNHGATMVSGLVLASQANIIPNTSDNISTNSTT